MFSVIKTFLKADTGAVTVDWVVLCAAVVGLGVASVTAVRTGTSSLSSDISTSLSAASVASLGSLGDDGYVGAKVQGYAGGDAWYEAGVCGKMDCAPGQFIVNAAYLMKDGSTWTMHSVQPDGGETVTIWRNGDGNVVDAPRFQDT